MRDEQERSEGRRPFARPNEAEGQPKDKAPVKAAGPTAPLRRRIFEKCSKCFLKVRRVAEYVRDLLRVEGGAGRDP